MGGKPRAVAGAAWAPVPLLPPPPDACQVCERKHEPNLPHDAQSVYWHVRRQMDGEPPPTWDDALAHVSDEMHLALCVELLKHGVTVAPRGTDA